MGNDRNFKLVTYFVAHATARITRETATEKIPQLGGKLSGNRL